MRTPSRLLMRIKGYHFDWLVIDDLIGEQTPMTKKKETFSFDDIVQEDSPLKPPFVRIPTEYFGGLNSLWERMYHWCTAHPNDVVYQVNYAKKEHTWYFVTREAYLEFVKEFPEVLRGEDSEF